MENWNKFLNEEEVPAPLPAEEFEKIMADLKSDELNEGFMQDLASTVRYFAKPLAIAAVLGAGGVAASNAYNMVQNTQDEITAQIQDSEDPHQELKDHYDQKINDLKRDIRKFDAEADFYENEKGDLEGARKFREKSSQLRQVLEDMQTRKDNLISPDATEYFTVKLGSPDTIKQVPVSMGKMTATTTPPALK